MREVQAEERRGQLFVGTSLARRMPVKQTDGFLSIFFFVESSVYIRGAIFFFLNISNILLCPRKPFLQLDLAISPGRANKKNESPGKNSKFNISWILEFIQCQNRA